jgi:Tfp pilus assembly protein FimT
VNRKLQIANREWHRVYCKKDRSGKMEEKTATNCKLLNIERRTLRHFSGGQALNIERFSFGFTSVELIVVIIALSILAGTAVVSFRVSDQDKSTIAADQLIADIQYVQMRAMGIGSTQNIQFANGSNGYDPDEYSISGEPGTKRLPDKDGKIVITGTNFSAQNNILYFNSLGEPCLAYSSVPPATCTSCPNAVGDNCRISLGISGTGMTTITVHNITGKVE